MVAIIPSYEQNCQVTYLNPVNDVFERFLHFFCPIVPILFNSVQFIPCGVYFSIEMFGLWYWQFGMKSKGVSGLIVTFFQKICTWEFAFRTHLRNQYNFQVLLSFVFFTHWSRADPWIFQPWMGSCSSWMTADFYHTFSSFLKQSLVNLGSISARQHISDTFFRKTLTFHSSFYA